MRALLLIAAAGLLLPALGCGGGVSEEDKGAIQAALDAYWQKRDNKAKSRVKEVSIEGDKATVKFSLTFPEFHSISTTRVGHAERAGGQWTIVSVDE